jgi:hypothetical protein
MRSALAVGIALLVIATACDGDRRTLAPERTVGPIVAIAFSAPDSVLEAGTSAQVSIVGLDALGRTTGVLNDAVYTVDNPFSLFVSPDGVVTALYSSFRPFSSTVTASVSRDGMTLTRAKRFDVSSAEPRRYDFFTPLLPEDVRPEPISSTADGIVYLTVAGSRIDFTLLWSHLSGRPISAHIHGPVESDEVSGELADIPIGNQFADHGVVRGTLTANDIRSRDGRPPISLDSLVTLLGRFAAYADVHTAAYPAGELRGLLYPHP